MVSTNEFTSEMKRPSWLELNINKYLHNTKTKEKNRNKPNLILLTLQNIKITCQYKKENARLHKVLEFSFCRAIKEQFIFCTSQFKPCDIKSHPMKALLRNLKFMWDNKHQAHVYMEWHTTLVNLHISDIQWLMGNWYMLEMKT